MRKLETRIYKKGFVYIQIMRTAYKAMYQQREAITEQVIGHEVFYIKQANESEAFGVTFPEREIYPSDNDFGVTAWSTGLNIDKAYDKYDSLIERITQDATK